MFIEDCVKGSKMIMDSDFVDPINLGSSELVSINELVSIVEDIAGIRLRRNYNLGAPQGVRGRNSDNTLIQKEFGWEPSIALRDGLEKTYAWVFDMVKRNA
jgi:nucleoside-diphosphate-sugar epimerase